MNLITKAFNKIFKSGNQQELDKIKPLIKAINDLEPSIALLKDSEFKEKTSILKSSISKGRKLHDSMLNYSAERNEIIVQGFVPDDLDAWAK